MIKFRPYSTDCSYCNQPTNQPFFLKAMVESQSRREEQFREDSNTPLQLEHTDICILVSTKANGYFFVEKLWIVRVYLDSMVGGGSPDQRIKQIIYMAS